MATQSKAPNPRPTTAPNRRSKLRLRPEAEVVEDDPSDPDNGDPAGWPAWTDRHAYTITRR